MRCYYEELGVARDASDADIKTSYRKLALRWHPDKNPDEEAAAKERFQLIQQAYEVLSDAQERAWYDNHREQILRGKNSEYVENSLDVFCYFTVSCYKGYGDDAKGFYSVYREVFKKIAAEDAEFMDDESECDIPEFGDSQSNYEEVVGPFYAYWQSYSTKKTYAWLCPYDIREIKDRYVLRQVEKEMKKIMQKARKERNEEVRNLVSFVRKRDRRVQAYRRQLEERAELNRQKQEEKRKEQLRKRQQDLAAVRQKEVFNERYEEQLKQLDQEYASDSESDLNEYACSSNNSKVDETEDYEDYLDELYCVACNKSFKNANAFANHEDSKKHKDNIERMCAEMQQEEEAFNKSANTDEEEHVEAESDDVHSIEAALNEVELNGDEEMLHRSETEEINEEKVENLSSKRNKRNKKSKKSNIMLQQSDEEETAPDFESLQKKPNEDSDEDDWGNNNNTKKGNKKNKNKKQTNVKKNENEMSATKGNDTTTAAKPAEETITATKKLASTEEAASATLAQHICATCRSTFDSKNKLFAHLKKTNHGVYIPKAKPDVEAKPQKSKGKRK